MPIDAVTPAEALILLNPAKLHGREAIKATLLGLLVRGVLRLETQPGAGIFHRSRTSLQIAANAPPDLPPGEAALVGLVREAEAAGGPMMQFVRRARARFGADLGRFDRDVVRPGLVRRGLLVETQRRVLFVFTRRRYRLTAAGEAERQRIAEAMQRLREIPQMLERDPAAAAVLAAGAGAAIFLVPELKKSYGRLSAALRAGDAAVDAPLLVAGFDLGGMDFGNIDGGGFDAFDSAVASFDASFDSAVDAGGGGDGGSGGC